MFGMKTDIQFGAFDNEDERIRTAILNHLKKMWANCQDDICGVHVEDAIDWLEKQGEHNYDIIIQNFRVGDNIKTTNEEPLNITKIDDKGYWSEDLFICGFDDAAKWELVEQKTTDKPKFRPGDWITFYGGVPFKILKIEAEYNGILDYLLLDQNGHDSFYNKKYVDENARLWNIQDAKCGDVLICKGDIKYSNGIKYERICLFNNLENAFSTLTKTLNYVEECDIDVRIDYPDNTIPATKEQRDFLLQKMKESGYKWDAKNKEVRKIEPDYPWS